MISAFKYRRVYSCLKHIWKIMKILESRTTRIVPHSLQCLIEGAGDNEPNVLIPVWSIDCLASHHSHHNSEARFSDHSRGSWTDQLTTPANLSHANNTSSSQLVVRSTHPQLFFPRFTPLIISLTSSVCSCSWYNICGNIPLERDGKPEDEFDFLRVFMSNRRHRAPAHVPHICNCVHTARTSADYLHWLMKKYGG